MAKKTAKKAAKKTGEGEAKGRVKLSELPQGERDTMAHDLIDELYGGKLDADEKSKRRQRLRTIDANWLETYAAYVERKGYNKAAEKPVKKVTKKAAKSANTTTPTSPLPA